MKTLLILCASIALIKPAAEAQQRSSVDVPDSFEVASVKPVGPSRAEAAVVATQQAAWVGMRSVVRAIRFRGTR
jgi:hypothetical protein